MSLKETQHYLHASEGNEVLLSPGDSFTNFLHRARDPHVQTEEKHSLSSFESLQEIEKITTLLNEKSVGISSSCHVGRRIMALSAISSQETSAKSNSPISFPGPMACTLSRRNFSVLFDCRDGTESYFVTEKSDGVRVVLYSKYEPDFFGWELESIGEQWKFSFTDALSLLKAKIVLDESNGGDTVPLKLSKRFLTFIARAISTSEEHGVILSLGSSNSSHLSSSLLDDAVQYDLVVCDSKDHLNKKVMSIFFCPKQGREFVYFFDRSCDQLYLLNEYKNMGNRAMEHAGVSGEVSEYLCDGELYHNLNGSSNRVSMSYSAFDLFGLSVSRGAQSESETTLNIGQDNITCLKSRLQLLEKLFPESPLPRKSSTIAFLRKKYYGMNEVAALCAKITCAKGKHVFDSKNYNDGLVFTPVSQQLFRLLPGRSPFLFKWKWNAEQTIDWLVNFQHPVIETAQEKILNVSLYFSIRHKIGAGGTVLEGHMLSQHVAQVHVDAGSDIKNRSSVCELQLLPSQDHTQSRPPQWKLCRIRNDKTEGNSLQTISNVLEAMTENIGISEIQKKCMGTLQNTSPDKTHIHTPDDLPEVHLIAKIYPRGNMKDSEYKPVIKLQALVNPNDLLSNSTFSKVTNADISSSPISFDRTRKTYIPQRPFPVNVIDESHYTYPVSVENLDAAHAAFAIAIANNGGSETFTETAVRVVFNPAQGKWVIIKIYRRSPEMHFDAAQIIAHLIHLSSLTGEGHVHVDTQIPNFADLFDSSLSTAFTESSQQYFGNTTTKSSVFHHYDEITKNVSDTRIAHHESSLESCHEIRAMNNFIKYTLLTHGIQVVHTKPTQLLVLDLCSGRGGDLMKMKHLNGAQSPCAARAYIRGVLCIDGSLLSLGTAACRYSVTPGLAVNSTKKNPADRRSHRPIGIPLRFIHADCFAVSLQSAYQEFLRDIGGSTSAQFDIVSIQFALHYAFISEDKLRTLLKNVTSHLRSGGVLIATFVDEKHILGRMNDGENQIWKSSKETCMVKMVPSDSPSVYERSYFFYLGDVVNGEREYLVNLDHFVKVAAEFGLSAMLLCHSFQELFDGAMSGIHPSAKAPHQKFPEMADKFSHFWPSLKRKSSSEEGNGIHKWVELPSETQEVCGLYKGMILRKA